MFYKFFCMTHPNRGGHTQKTEKPDFRIRMNRDGSEKKITYIKPYSTKKRASRASALRADRAIHIRGLILTPGTSPTP